jgi:Meckel syndrome type 1 protein
VWKSFASAASLLLMASGPVSAQQTAPKPDTAEAKAAMERAQRMADNPMRVILQASKIKRKGNESDTPEPVVDPASLRRTAVRTGAEPAARDAATAPAGANTRPVAALPGLASALPAVAAPAPAPEPPPAKVMPSALLTNSASSNVPSLEIAQPLEAAPVTTKAVAPQAIPIVPANVRPTIVTMVEPEIPVRLLSDSGRVSEVFADLNLREDGTVAAVTLLPPVPRSWARYIAVALEKWRFEPLPAARTHRVQLVFDDNK